MAAPRIRKGQAPASLKREEFRRRFVTLFNDPAYRGEELASVEAIAWGAYKESRKAPVTRKAGRGFADPDYELSVEWSATRKRLLEAQRKQQRRGTRSRVLIVLGAARNDGTCPGEVSKTFRFGRLVREEIESAGFLADVLDLSLLTSEPALRIFPCKGCVSTAMPLCHWPCSCYPNNALHQTNDWMAEIYERWVAAHGVVILTPVYWYQAPSPLKLMMDRLVCADGGNPDPTTTQGKDARKAKALELAGWSYPKHLAGRVYGLFVHGDVAGIESVRRSLCDWLDWMGLHDAGDLARLDRYVGYYEPYATSHDALDADAAVRAEVRNIARAVVKAVRLRRAGKLPEPDATLRRPRPK